MFFKNLQVFYQSQNPLQPAVVSQVTVTINNDNCKKYMHLWEQLKKNDE